MTIAWKKKMISRPDSRELTQGTIFTCALTENYLDCNSYGIIITARCDVANGKAPIFSYVPVVPYRDWSVRDGARIVAARAISNCTGELKRMLKSAELSETILETISIETVLGKVQEDQSKQGKARAAKFEENCTQIKEAQAFLTATNRNDPQGILNRHSGIYQGLVKELLGNAVSDYHYLEEIEFEGKTDGYVALLREIRFMPSSVAARILNGLTRNEFHSLNASGVHFGSDDDYAMPIGLLKSPYIEFLMQRLTNLFARIGVTDVSKGRLDALKTMFEENVEVKA
jgi:hypothetical protein